MTSSRIAALSAIAATALMIGSLAASATCADSTGMHADAGAGSARHGATTVGFSSPATTGSIGNRTASIKANNSEASSALGRSQWTGSVQLFW